jgi:hypothetical protein
VKLQLIRNKSSEKSTIGRLLIENVFQCWTLEDVVRPAKIAGETAIPAGTYKVIINESNRFKRRLPLLVGVPGFEGIRIHPGNCAHDTEGCILVGTSSTKDWVGGSRAAFDSLFSMLEHANPDTMEITILDAK